MNLSTVPNLSVVEPEEVELKVAHKSVTLYLNPQGRHSRKATVKNARIGRRMRIRSSASGYILEIPKNRMIVSKTACVSVAHLGVRVSLSLKKTALNADFNLEGRFMKSIWLLNRGRKLLPIRFSVGALLIFVSVTALAFGIIVVPRIRESEGVSRFGLDGDGGLEESSLSRSAPSRLDRILGFDGFVCNVYLFGRDSALLPQLEALSSFKNLRTVYVSSVDTYVNLNGEFKLSSIREAHFSYCEPNFVRDILQRMDGVQSIEIWECLELKDHHLEVIADLSQLRSLDIDGSSVAGTFVDGLNAATKLRSLGIRNSPISTAGLVSISRLRTLKQLALEHPTSDVCWDTVNYYLQAQGGIDSLELRLAGFLDPLHPSSGEPGVTSDDKTNPPAD